MGVCVVKAPSFPTGQRLSDPRIERPNKESPQSARLRDAHTFGKVDSSGRHCRENVLSGLLVERLSLSLSPRPAEANVRRLATRDLLWASLGLHLCLCLQAINIVKSGQKDRYRGRRPYPQWAAQQWDSLRVPNPSLESDYVSNENPSSRSLKIPRKKFSKMSRNASDQTKRKALGKIHHTDLMDLFLSLLLAIASLGLL